MPALRTHVDVVMAALAAANVKAFRGIGPENPLEEAPYAVVYGGTATTDGPMGSMWADAMVEVQVTSVGRQADQVEWMADAVFAALVDQPLAPPAGRSWLRPGAPVGHELTRPVTRDQDFGEGSPMFYVVALYALPSTPA